MPKNIQNPLLNCNQVPVCLQGMTRLRIIEKQKGARHLITMQRIAELCGVSRGTVDRALNRRGRVNPDTARTIREMAKALGYEPNPAGKALAARKNLPVVAVLLPSEGNPFFDEVMHGIETAAKAYAIYGLSLRWEHMKGYDWQDQLARIKTLATEANALIIVPIDHPKIREALNDLVDRGMFVVALNNDLDNCRRHCYVGADYVNGGETACALFEAFLGTKANLGVIMGSTNVMGHRQRLEGFRKRMARLPNFSIATVIENEDDEFFSYSRTQKMLQTYPNLDGIFIIAGGVYGACRAIEELPTEKRPLTIAFDSVPSTVEMMKRGIVRAILYQHPYRQGRRAMEIVFEYLVNGIAPSKEKHIMKNEIKLLENL